MFNKFRNSILKLKKSVLKDGRFYLQDKVLSEKTKFKPGVPYKYLISETEHMIEIIPDKAGDKIVSKRCDKDGNFEKSVIDIRNSQIKKILTNKYVTIAICEDKIIVVAFQTAASQINRDLSLVDEITSMTFCAGGGISAYFSHKAGFKERALVEYNPDINESQWNKYADIAEKNHPDSIIFNIPIEEFSADMLPDQTPDVWMVTLPCNDFSILKNNRETEEGKYTSMHHFLHLVRIFTEVPNEKKPACIFIENVPQFEKIAGQSLKYFFRDMGYYVSSEVLDSANFGSRVHRKRWYLCANIYSDFKFPTPTGEITTPLDTEEWFNLENFDWKNTVNSMSINRLVNRFSKNSNTMRIKAIDPSIDAISYTIPKNYRISVPQGMIQHPTKVDTYAIFPINYLKKLFKLPDDFYVGDVKTTQYEAIGQSVDGTIMQVIYNSLYKFLRNWKDIIVSQDENTKPIIKDDNVIFNGFKEQIALNF